MLRDMYARKGYKDMEKESYRRGELYISRIIDEEMKKMIYAYDKVYLRIAQRSLGEMLSYAVYDLGYELEDYYKRFCSLNIVCAFQKAIYL